MDLATTQRILIVTGDDAVTDAMGALVARQGGRPSIRCTASGQEVLRWLQEDPTYDLLIVDFKTADMTGPMLYRRLLARWPSACPPVLFVSDDMDVTGYEQDLEVLSMPLLFKPFGIDELSAAVTRALTTVQPRRTLISPRKPRH
ncbi:MAG TPA: response regulator [Mycobacterium sp.]|nr:response regulator [Mycobacterium sp.]